jgi:hypothetical protein
LDEQEIIMTPTPRHAPLALLILAAVLTLTACSSSSPPTCSDSACATTEIQASLIGLEAKDGAAITKASCKPAVLNPGGTWTASCTVTESDGAKSAGNGNWFVSTEKVTYEPTAAA